MQPTQQVLEHAAGLVLFARPSSEGAAKRRRDPGLIGQAFNTDDTALHVKLFRLL